MTTWFVEKEKKLRVESEPDVLVVGGGSAGIAAACAAARSGAETLLIDRFGFLGGTVSAVTLGGLCGGFAVEEDELLPVVGGFYQELMSRLESVDGVLPVRRTGKVHGVPYDPNLFKLVADDVISASGVRVLLHTYAVAEYGDEGVIREVVIENKGGRAVIRPKMVIDCSGDGDVAAQAGASFEIGEAGVTQFGSCMFRVSNVDAEQFLACSRQEIMDILEDAVREGAPLPRTAVALYPNPVSGVVHLNATRLAKPDGSPFNLVDPYDLTAAEQEGRRQAYLYLAVARERLPGFANAQIVDIGPLVGIRETRRISGDYTLTGEDVLQGSKPDDGVVCSAWPIEIHSAGKKTVWQHLQDGDYYKIPYRCLTVSGFSNLLVAGRNLSATHEAQASARVAATCFGMGEAAGLAASLGLESGGDVRGFDGKLLRKRLLDNGAMLDP